MESLVVGDIAELKPNQVGPLFYFCSVNVLRYEPANPSESWFQAWGHRAGADIVSQDLYSWGMESLRGLG